MQPSVIILLGPPGAGKGSQATLIKEKLSLPHIATGNLLREQVALETSLGLEAKRYMNAGEFPPEALILKILFERLSQPDCSKGYILDGFPRTLYQAEMLSSHLKDSAPIIAISLELPDKEIVERLSGRVVCQGCQTPFHQVLSPPAKQGRCDHCQGLLIQRKDDEEATIKRRLEVYHEQTAPLIAYYQSRGLLYSIPSNQSKKAMLLQILKLLERHLMSKSLR